ncbi:ZIP zinc transporter-domain-containing protein [Phascolomyces articulosus]|uniref:ZIP zinc transporter-domain-containing protein n=1 Tax=Phascolomyces articulosus TaxID=60185 RepID=A0AAD5KUI2_9FUNG|nr:ZIP zinc transporter-domain-containing protein [Phascolomyces articulosus]
MVNPFIWLLLLCITMLVGSFLAGCIPLSTKLSESKLRHLTALGVGLLIGTALVVIIPEGIQTLYSSSASEIAENSHGGSGIPVHRAAIESHPSPWQENAVNYTSSLPSSTPYASPGILDKRQEPHNHEEHTSSTEHTAIGLALIVGFATMFIVDQLSSLHIHSTYEPTATSEQSASNGPPSPSNNSTGGGGGSRSRSPTARSMTPTIGLIVHAAADGIALGASASHPQLSMVVFLAIMLHKAPSAFALTTVLLAEGLSRISVRRHLLMFSMSAPTGAIVTYILLNTFSSASSSSGASIHLAYWTGVLLVYSGGTFLYVAMHALQELQPPSQHSDKLAGSQVGCILAGMFLPVLLNIGHSH